MSDLISRKALIKELNELWRYVNFNGDKDVFDIIMKAKAIEQGEPILLNNMSNSPEHVKAYIRQQMPDISKELVALMTKPNIDEIVSRFLSWKLPKDFNPDANINFYRQYEHDSPHYPLGTNLFTAEQAKEMFRNVLAGAHVELHTTPQQTQEQGELVRKAIAGALEEAAKLLESQRFMALDITKTYTAEEHRQGLKSSVAFLAKQIRALIKRNTEGV